MDIREARDPNAFDAFLASQKFRPFLQSWTMGEVYRDIGQEPVRLEAVEDGKIAGICMAHFVPARRGRHLSVPYGPLASPDAMPALMNALKQEAEKRNCLFIRLSPFAPALSPLPIADSRPSPLPLLAEHVWYLPLVTPDPWGSMEGGTPRKEAEIFSGMRATARNLIRRAEKEGVTIECSTNPIEDLKFFISLHDETRLRHKFTPYTTAFFRAQVARFHEKKHVLLYLARYKGEVIASSIHMNFAGETSYHHGASTVRFRNIPASYLLQWTAIRDALKRGDHIYNFWGISPEGVTRHPFAGVRTFKTAFGGTLLELQHCVDLPLSSFYTFTRAIETCRKYRRGF